MRKIRSVRALETFGRTRLSNSFFMRDMLYSEVSSFYGIPNIPTDPDLAIFAGKKLCEQLLEPLKDQFGTISVRSAYRSPEVNAFCNERELGCASNKRNAAKHIWDQRDRDGHVGAMATIIIHSFVPYFESTGNWQGMAWYIHEHLPYSTLCFYPKLGAFNIGWHERPERRISSQIQPRCSLTHPSIKSSSEERSQSYMDMLASITAQASD